MNTKLQSNLFSAAHYYDVYNDNKNRNHGGAVQS